MSQKNRLKTCMSFFLFVQIFALSFADNALYVVKTNTVNFTRSTQCPPEEILQTHRQGLQQEVSDAIDSVISPILTDRYGSAIPCSCGGPGWTKVASLDMSNPNETCPYPWRLRTDVRGCGGISSRSCDSVTFSTRGISYSKVCGKVIAYQFGTPEGFFPISQGWQATLDSAYIGGVSLTHGRPGSRQHIWSFVCAVTDYLPSPAPICPCTVTDQAWPYEVYSYVGNNYFCDTARHDPWNNAYVVYHDDPLWDGKGCPPHSSCCQFNNPPWFCTSLPQPTADDLEVRICNLEGLSIEDVIIKSIDLYVQ